MAYALLLSIFGCKQAKDQEGGDYAKDFRGSSVACIKPSDGHCPNTQQELEGSEKPNKIYLTWHVEKSGTNRTLQCSTCFSDPNILNDKPGADSDLVRCKIDPYLIGEISAKPKSYTNEIVFDTFLPKGGNYLKRR